MKLDYRADIDGLRAVAVLLVIAFHAQVGLFPGGFIGVDVFFVISGFLITSLILKHDGTALEFLKRFYEGRVRRLIPPAIPVLIFSILASCFLLSLEAMTEFGKSLLAAILFVSNWFFLGISGYFDSPSYLKPLLHTWSLSVEEQFYIFFPIAALLLMQFKRSLTRFTLFVFFASLAFNLYLVENNSLTSAFFNSFGRFWEITLGGLLALGVIKTPSTATARNLLSMTGLLLILGCGIFIDKKMPFPGAIALIPTIGAAMLIIARHGYGNKLLALKPLVGVGLISYALYLWHWPIFTFLTIYSIKPTSLDFAVATMLTFIISTISYYVIERPIRSKSYLPKQPHVVAFFSGATLVFAIFSISTIATNGFPYRLNSASLVYQETLKNEVQSFAQSAQRSKCWIPSEQKLETILENCVGASDGQPRVLLVGDSHAAQYFDAMKKKFINVDLRLLAGDSCSLTNSIFETTRTAPTRIFCFELISYLDQIKPDQFEAIIISTRAFMNENGLREFIGRLGRLSTVSKIYLLGPIPYYKPNMQAIYSTSVGKFSRDTISSRLDKALQQDRFEMNRVFKAATSNLPNVSFISLIDEICTNGHCQHFDDHSLPILIDDSHLSLETSHKLVERIADQFPANWQKDISTY